MTNLRRRSGRIALVVSVFVTVAFLRTMGQDAGTPEVPDAAGGAGVATAGATAADGTAGSAEDAGLSGGEAFLRKVAEGGWTMAVLLALSIVAVATTFERYAHLRRRAFVPDGIAAEVRRLWQSGEFDAVVRLCQAHPSVYTRIVAHLAANHTDSPEMLAQEAEELGQQELWQHVRRTKPLSVIATLSPLLGLFGTVIGMIESFDTVALMGELGDASMLAGGISKALITTAGGLVIAIPALGLYYNLRSRAEFLGHVVECELTELLRRCVRRRSGGAAAPEGAR